MERRREALFWGAMLALTAARLGLAAALPLTPDEAYYRLWSRHLQWGYPDHPFMVALWIRAGTWIAGDTPLGVRLLGPLSALAGSAALLHAARGLVPGRDWPREWRLSGMRAAMLLNATVMIGIGAAVMTPDTPLVFFITLALLAAGKAVSSRGACWWALTGLALGLAFDSKYTAALIAMAFAGAVPAVPELRRQRGPWLAPLFALLPVLPVLVWNAAHHWVSFLRQGGRVADWKPGRAAQFLGELIGGQIGLATPLVAVLFAAGAIACIRRAPLLAWLCLLPSCVFVVHALGDRVQANWPVIAYPAFALAAARLGWRVRWAAVTGVAITFLLYAQALFAPLPLPASKDPFLRQTAGWTDLRHAIARAARERGLTRIVAADYGLASELALGEKEFTVIGGDSRWRDIAGLVPAAAGPALRVEELRGAAAGEAVCRESRGRVVRCYRITRVENAGGMVISGPP